MVFPPPIRFRSCCFLFWIIFKFVDRIFHENQNLPRARKERQIAPQASAGVCFPKSPRLTSAKHRGGREKKTSRQRQGTPATAKMGQPPHDCKQYDFPSGALELLDISKIAAFWPSTNLEMVFFF
ncbi:MAG: hypothetical protein AMJ94_19465 [Deltaproteobacteria bacterium SM23_61]|nr:MAG: hypothetical protein AMJ94_19465 [Deltaproteobacteria bacterium SM23_61]